MSPSPLALFLALAGCGAGWLHPAHPDTATSDTVGETGTSDDTGPADPWWWGTGEDGDLDVMGRVDLSTWISPHRTTADAVSFRVDAVGASSVSTTPWSTGIATGDEVLIIDVQGAPESTEATGSWAFAHVVSRDDAVISVEEDLATLLPALVGQDLAGHDVRVQRVPQYGRVEVFKAGALTTAAWDGQVGGIVAFRASEGVRVEAGGHITVDDAGYAGGSTGSRAGCDGYQGESLGGPGTGGQCAQPFNEAIGAYAANLGGGGANVTGGGGNHAGGATAGDAWRTQATPPAAGEPYGEPKLTRVYLGSGGGGVWYGAGDPGPGGAGGGILVIGASSLAVVGSDGLTARGQDAVSWSDGSLTFGAGGGAGGSILVVASEVELAWNSVIATGGEGETEHDRHGGHGGDGRIRVDCVTCNGEAGGSTGATQALAEASDPDPGWSAVPSR